MTAIRADSSGWLAARCGLVTASRMNDVLDIRKDGKPGAGRKRYMAELVAERITGQVCDHPVTGPMLRGREQQPNACAAYEAATGNIVGPEMFVTHPTIEFAGATPDGTVDDDGLVEFKVPLTHNFVDWVLDGGVPEQHVAQLTWQIACTRRTWVDFCAFSPEIHGPSRSPTSRRRCASSWHRSKSRSVPLPSAVQHDPRRHPRPRRTGRAPIPLPARSLPALMRAPAR